MPKVIYLTSFRLRAYDPESALICLDDEDASLLVDISLCLSGDDSYPWLRERNSVVMTIGYLETLDHLPDDVSISIYWSGNLFERCVL